MSKIDAFTHILPPRYLKALSLKNETAVRQRLSPVLSSAHHELDARFRIMDRYEGYVQILSLAIPPVEDIAAPELATELARMANDEMAELVAKYPDRFVAAVACLPMNDVDAALREAERAVMELGFKGFQITTTIMDKPVDSAEFDPLFRKMNEYGLPVLMHPRNIETGLRAMVPRGQGDPVQYLAQGPFNWPFETTIAMGRIVFSGMLGRYPNLKIVTHHCGGMIPYQRERITNGFERAKQQGTHRLLAKSFAQEPIEYYRMMYGDTACWGNTSALMCGYDFFGSDHVLFATDMPFGYDGGEVFVRNTIRSIEEMTISDGDRRKIFELNARRLFRLGM